MGKLKDTIIEGKLDVSGNVTSQGDLLSKIAKLYTLNNFNPVSNGIRSYYAQWKIEVPIMESGVTKVFKIIGGMTPSEEGAKQVWFRMDNNKSTNVFSSIVLGCFSVGLRTGSTSNGWQYGQWTNEYANITQVSTGSVWFAFGI